MGIPVIANDIGGPYVPPGPGTPQIALMVLGSATVFIKGGSVMLFPGPSITTLGPIISSTLNSTTTTINSQQVILGGSVTNLGSGFSNGVVTALGAIGVIVN